LSTFPSPTTTFVTREILGLQRRQVNLVLISIHKPAPFETGAEIQKLAQTTRYLLPAPWPWFLAAHLHFVLTQPRAYLGTLFYLLTRQHNQLSAWLRTLFYFAVGVWAAQVLQGEKVNHIHAHFAARSTVVAMVISRLLRVPYSLTAHAYDIYKSPAILSAKIDGAKFVATCTDYNAKYLRSLDDSRFAGKIHLIYHGLDLAQFSSLDWTARNGHRPFLLSIGQLKEKKGFPYLIQACRLLKDRGYDLRCEIVGDGPKRSELTALIANLGLEDTIVLCGALPYSEVMRRYAQATLFALPCVLGADGDRDGIPNVLLEAMAMHIPVVSTRFSGIPEVIEDGLTGLLVPSRDAEALARALARLLDDPDLRQKLGHLGRRQVEERFDIRTNVKQLVELFEM
jgi:glycosyltransferase involved in cell wall biosynthesis